MELAGATTTKEDVEAGGREEAELTLRWRSITYRVPGKTIVEGLSGVASSGQVTAIMGPSGCGKTTLLDILANRVDKTKKGRSLTGSVTVNGVVKGGPRRAYVQQEDALVGVLTTKETLGVAAKFAKAPPGRVLELLREFGLESAKDTLVGTIFHKGLSGGQKRRLSIAVELVSRPRVVLADEPTSGLDSASAFAVVDQLRKVAKATGECRTCARVAVAATLHQPSNAVYAFIDDVCFLAKGKVVYFGDPTATLLAFFEGCGYPVPHYANIADFVLSLTNTDFPGHADVDLLTDAFAARSSEESSGEKGTKEDDDDEGPSFVALASRRSDSSWSRASRLSRFATLCEREFKEIRRDVGIIGVRLAMYTMLSVLITLMYLNLGRKKGDSDVTARVSILFYVAAFLVFMSVAVLPFFVIQRAVFVKERCNGTYDVPEYVAAKFVTSVPGVFLIAIVSSVLIVFPTGLNGFPIYFLDLFVSLLVAESCMAFLGAVVPHFIIGIAVAAGFFGFNMLCEGFFRVKHDIPIYLVWAYYQAFHTYTFRIFMHNEFNRISHFDGPQFRDGHHVLRFYDMADVDVLHDFLVLVAWILFFQLAFALTLHFFHTGKR
mmetsp:Transcript_15619/g.51119  ORF Transcript_15619/g.51119 Transcript_15619/m.51119 type:complete len:606 (+) Transcript_15619:65-1882(+)